jgi:phosphoglycerate dehydrogenase-like enzyme
MKKTFHIALTGDFYDNGKPRYQQMGLSVFADHPGIVYRPFAEHLPEITPEQIGAANGVVVLSPKVTAKSVSQAENLLAIGRFGVGYDAVDVPALTEADVALLITVGAVDRPVAEATVGWMIALTHHVKAKDRLTREGRWDERSNYMGSELRGRTLGIIGFGGIGRALQRLLAGFGMNTPLVFDPFLTDGQVCDAGCRKVTLDELMSEADFVSIHCPLTPETRGLIGDAQIRKMKSSAYLLNTARGGIVDEDALYAALEERRIAGAALDCFVGEPVRQPSRFGKFENVLLAPHSIAWTHEMFRDIGTTACQGMIDLANGRKPKGVINPQVFKRPGFREKWGRVSLQPPQFDA